MNVLSLFDGCSCAMIALNRLGIKVDNYFASEIDKYAIQVSKANWPEIKHIGDVTKVHYFEGVLYTEFGNYEVSFANGLICGGSPCQGFSFAGKQLNFEDPRSKLFFEFVHIYEEIKAEHPDVKVFLENVVMKKEYQTVISEKLGFEHIYVDSSIFGAQVRKRLYWFNFDKNAIPKDKGIVINDILEPEVEKKYFLNQAQVDKLVKGNGSQQKDIKIIFHRKNFRRNLQVYDVNGKTETLDTGGGGGRFPCIAVKIGNTQPSGRGMNGNVFSSSSSFKAPTLTTNKGEGIKIGIMQLNPNKDSGGKQPYLQNRIFDADGKLPALTLESQRYKICIDELIFRRLTPIECERLQNVPDNYTSATSNSQRYKMLGNGWNVDTIVHLFEPLLWLDII